MVGFDVQRKNMVESQVRPSDITDRRIMRAMLDIPREAFAAEDTRALAYMDQELPVGLPTATPASAPTRRRVLLAPRVLSQLLQHLDVNEGDGVLEVGTATGYGAAVLARMARTVIALECDEALAARARTVLAAQTCTNVTVAVGPLAAGWPAEAPYSAILVSGTVPEIPPVLLDQLQDGGRLTAVMLEGGVGRLVLWRRFGSHFAVRVLAEAGARALPGFDRAAGFVF